jgi:hypothetical protein
MADHFDRVNHLKRILEVAHEMKTHFLFSSRKQITAAAFPSKAYYQDDDASNISLA